MAPEALSKVDTVTCLINVKHTWQEETEDHWANPSRYPFMREVLHESVHFWQAVGVPYFLRISCGAYRDFQEVRACAFRQSPNELVPVDQLQLEPNYLYFSGDQRLNRKFGELSGADIIEGLARYWDIHLCGMRHVIDRLVAEDNVSQDEVQKAQLEYGPFFLADGLQFTDAAVRFVFDQERLYNKAYDFAVKAVGRYAYILFPIIGFFALSSGGLSVSKFQQWINLYNETRPFEIPKGNFLQVWRTCREQAFKWITKELQEQLYSSLTVYSHLRKNMIGWAMTTPLPQRFGLMTPHGVLDRYLGNYWQWMRADDPAIPEQDVELSFHPAFCLPGDPFYRDILLKRFHPPVILFADGKTWVDETNWGQMTPKLEEELLAFGGEMGAAMALSGAFDVETLKVNCSHTTCPWHSTRLCWKVARFPDKPENCIMPNLYRTQMNLDLPTNKDWNVGHIDRPINRESVALSIELE